MNTTRLTLEQALHLGLHDALSRDPAVLLMGEGVATKHRDWVGEFGAQRVRNTPLAEAIIAGTAVGAAAAGLRPIVDLLFAPFMTYTMDALINSAGKIRYLSGGQFRFPLVALAMTGSGWGVGAQHNHNLEAMFVQAPGLKVVMPSEPADVLGLLRSSVADDNPVVFLIDLGLLGREGPVPDDPAFTVPLGQAAVRRSGDDLTLVAYGKAVGICLDAAARLADRGIAAEVIDLRSLKPLDTTTVLASVRRTGRLMVVHEAAGPCGVGAEIAALTSEQAFAALRAPVVRLTGPDAPSAASWVLEQAAVPQQAEVVEAALGLLSNKAEA
jgi:pyruvate dehydrogenase E1 component beta subunit